MPIIKLNRSRVRDSSRDWIQRVDARREIQDLTYMKAGDVAEVLNGLIAAG